MEHKIDKIILAVSLIKCQNSYRWISCRKNMGYHATDPKIQTQGAERGRSWIAMKHGDGSLKSSNAQHTAERDAELYPGSGPSWRGKTPTSCLLALRCDTSRGVQGLGYKASAKVLLPLIFLGKGLLLMRG
jgi:hypothetical protein